MKRILIAAIGAGLFVVATAGTSFAQGSNPSGGTPGPQGTGSTAGQGSTTTPGGGASTRSGGTIDNLNVPTAPGNTTDTTSPPAPPDRKGTEQGTGTSGAQPEGAPSQPQQQ
jgi:hypothetical protein